MVRVYCIGSHRTSKYMMGPFVYRVITLRIIISLCDYLKDCCHMTSEIATIPLLLHNIEVPVLWLSKFFLFVHSETNLQYNIVIKIPISIKIPCVPDMLLACYCRTTAVELCTAGFVLSKCFILLAKAKPVLPPAGTSLSPWTHVEGGSVSWEKSLFCPVSLSLTCPHKNVFGCFVV